jgi:hypothetical protein
LNGQEKVQGSRIKAEEKPAGFVVSLWAAQSPCGEFLQQRDFPGCRLFRRWDGAQDEKFKDGFLFKQEVLNLVFPAKFTEHTQIFCVLYGFKLFTLKYHNCCTMGQLFIIYSYGK